MMLMVKVRGSVEHCGIPRVMAASRRRKTKKELDFVSSGWLDVGWFARVADLYYLDFIFLDSPSSVLRLALVAPCPQYLTCVCGGGRAWGWGPTGGIRGDGRWEGVVRHRL